MVPSPPSRETAADGEPVAAQPNGAVTIDFEAVKETKSVTWQTALNADTTIESGARPDLFVVIVSQKQMPANTSIAKRSAQEYIGWCSCRVFDRTGLCPHLCVLRQHEALDKLTIPYCTA